MNVTLERNALAYALARVTAIVDQKHTVPILANIYLSASGDTLTIRGTNLEMEAVETMSANVIDDGEITVPVATLGEIARNLPQGAQINLTMNKAQLTVTSGRSRFNLPTIPATDFPQMWSTNWTSEIEIDSDKLSYMVGRVAFAQDDRTAYANRMGVHVHRTEAGRLRFVATDGVVITYVDGPEVEEFNPCTIPTRMVSEVARMVGTVKLVFSPGLIMARNDQSTVTSKLIDGSLKFPPYERVFHSSSPNGAIIRLDALLSALRRAAIAKDPTANDQAVRLTFTPGALAVTARNQVADAFDEIDIEYDGPNDTMNITPSRLIELLGSMSTDTICVGFGGNKSPLVWMMPGDEDGKAVIMPHKTA